MTRKKVKRCDKCGHKLPGQTKPPRASGGPIAISDEYRQFVERTLDDTPKVKTAAKPKSIDDVLKAYREQAIGA